MAIIVAWDRHKYAHVLTIRGYFCDNSIIKICNVEIALVVAGNAIRTAQNCNGCKLGVGYIPGDKVFKVTPEGVVSVFATGLVGASGNAFDSQGNLFQSNIGAASISKIAPDGTVTPFSNTGLE